jgi:methyl-accepting chemotaxis protein
LYQIFDGHQIIKISIRFCINIKWKRRILLMKWFHDLRISTRLLGSFFLVAIIAGIIGIIGIVNLRNADDVYKSVFGNYGSSQGKIGYVYGEFESTRATLRDLVYEKNPTKYKQYQDTISNSDAIVEKNIQEYGKTILTVKEKEHYDKLVKAIKDFKTTRDKVVDLVLQNKNDEAIKLLQESGDIVIAATKEIESNLKLNIDTGTTIVNEQVDKTQRTSMILIVIVLIAVIVAIILGLFISRNISKPIKKIVDAANKLAEGNVDIELNINTEDEIGILGKAFERITKAIDNLVEDSNTLVAAASEGNLDTRIDIKKHRGHYRKIVEGFNKTLEIVIEPINEADKVLQKMSVNDLTLEVKGEYKGNIKKLKDSINIVRTRLLSVQDALERLGNGDTSRLEEFEKIGGRSENDKLMPACTAALKSIRGIINEANTLANAAVDGDLNVRGNSNNFKGGYKEIIDGMNRTMEAIVKPINEASDVMQEMAKGDLAVSMDGDYDGDYAKIKNNLNTTIRSINSVLHDINNTSLQVATGSKQVSDSAIALSQGSTEQASSIEELTASIEEIASQTKQNAINADQANQLAVSAKNGAVSGNDQMNEMLKAMNDINEASSNISKIIKVIDEIAFQTNILALNAAVEAARAGQHGKGFAVVAEEVRNLAARSANAAKETTILIEGSIKKVDGGMELANQTASALSNIVEGVTKVTALVGEIAIASNEQASGISQVNQGIMQVSKVVQTNSATSEESAAASQELSNQAAMLKELVNKFKLSKISYGNNLSDINPEILRMLENMVSNKNEHIIKQGNTIQENVPAAKIVLNDGEFGKY